MDVCNTTVYTANETLYIRVITLRVDREIMYIYNVPPRVRDGTLYSCYMTLYTYITTLYTYSVTMYVRNGTMYICSVTMYISNEAIDVFNEANRIYITLM